MSVGLLEKIQNFLLYFLENPLYQAENFGIIFHREAADREIPDRPFCCRSDGAHSGDPVDIGDRARKEADFFEFYRNRFRQTGARVVQKLATAAGRPAEQTA